jgi:Fe-S-cluster containining protein
MKCQKCGKCCCERTVALSNQDIINIKKVTNVDFYFTRKTGVKILKWKDYKNHKVCIFFNPDTNLCNIYENRPAVCRQYFCKTFQKIS